jgi:tol-pal system protein YbgF
LIYLGKSLDPEIAMKWRMTTAAFVVLSAVSAGATQANADDASRASWRGVQVAGLFGESDDEKAARLQHESDQDAELSDLKQRVHDLEQSLQQATGQNELLSHRLQELSQHVDQQAKDFDYKLCSLAAQQLGAGTSADATGGGLPCNTGGAMPPQSGVQGSGGTLGTLPANGAPISANRADYDAAMTLLAKAQYDGARAAFQSFADANPKDDLAPQALFWVGSIAYVQHDYQGAGKAFSDVVKKYPTSPRAAEALLKLGQSLLGMGMKKEGCLSLGAIKSKYPHASPAVLSQAASTRAASCK